MALPAALVLGACNGSGSEGPAAFQASLPQLTDDFEAFAQGQTYSTTTRAVQTNGSSGGSIQVNLSIRPANDGSGDLILTDGGTDFRLQRNASTGEYLYSDGSLVYFAQAALGEDAGAVLVFSQSLSSAAAAFVPVGRPSSDVGVQTGKAVYLGPSAFVAAFNNGATTSGTGGIVMEADFDSATVDGVIALTDVTQSTQFLLEFENAAISGNGFSSTNLTQQGLAASVNSSSLEATFNGAGAAEAGGVYTMDLVSGSAQAALAGAFVAGRQQGDLAAIAASGGTVALPGGEQIVLGSGSVIGGSGSVYPDGSSSYYNSNTGVNFGTDSNGCIYTSNWSNC